MTLTTHAVAGAGIASALSLGPLSGFVFAFASHFLLDAIPHWDYKLKSGKRDEGNHLNDDIVIGKEFGEDLAKIACDALLGLALSLIFFLFGDGLSLWTLLWAALGGILPDFLQFVYMKWRHEPMITLQKFHIWIHSPYKITNTPLGVSLQAIIIIVAACLGNWWLFF